MTDLTCAPDFLYLSISRSHKIRVLCSLMGTFMQRILGFCVGLLLSGWLTHVNPLIAASAELADFVRHGRLHVEGNQIVAEDGTPVVLRGGALMDLVEFNYTTATIDYLKSSHANLIRVPLHWGRGGLSASYETHMERFNALVDYSISQGLYVIADFHAVADPAQPGLESMAIRFFDDVARRYGKTGQVIYEVFNEPTGKSSYSEKVSWAAIKTYSVRRIDEIRAIDPEAFVIVPTMTWSQEINVPVTNPIPRSNIAYAFHFYASLHIFDEKYKEIASKIPLFVTEWAAQSPENSDGSIDFESFQRYADWMKQYSISWTAWSYSDEEQPYGWFTPGSMWDGVVEDKDLRPWGRIVRDLLDDGLLNQTFSW